MVVTSGVVGRIRVLRRNTAFLRTEISGSGEI